jgi:hypothetical protein
MISEQAKCCVNVYVPPCVCNISVGVSLNTMVNVRCQACQAKYRLLAAKRVNLLGLVLETRPMGKQQAIINGDYSNSSSRSSSYSNLSSLSGKPAPRFPYRPPIQRRPRSYILPPSPTVLLASHASPSSNNTLQMDLHSTYF